VIAAAFDAPLVTDAETDILLADDNAWVISDGGPTLFRYRGIRAVHVEGRLVPSQLVAPDVARVEMPSGRHRVRIVTGETSVETAMLPNEGVTTAELLTSACRAAQPGDEVVLRDGVYADWKATLVGAGTKEQPIVIRPQTPGGVTFRRDTRLRLGGQWLQLRGFQFEHCGPDTCLLLSAARDCRVTQCQFFGCGSPQRTFGHIVSVDMGSHRNRIDHCYFTGSKSMSLGQRIGAKGEPGTGNRFDHNLFRDIYRHWINGQENIQLGQNQRGASGAQRPRTIVEYNVFDHAWGDGEIISNKSSDNLIRYNLAAHCPHSAFTLRGGDDVRFEGNVMINNADGLRVMGTRHTIVNNVFRDMPGSGIVFETGHADGESMVATENTLVAHNTFLNCADGAVGGRATSQSRPHRPRNNTIINNLIVSSGKPLLETRHFQDTKIQRNLFWSGSENASPEQLGDVGEKAIVADAKLIEAALQPYPGENSPALDCGVELANVKLDSRGHRRPAGAGPDLGAVEVGGVLGSGRQVQLTPVPPPPSLEPDRFAGEVVFTQNAEDPLRGWSEAKRASSVGEAIEMVDSSLDLATAMPGDFVLSWEQQHDTFDCRAGVCFALDANNHGYRLNWGGADDKGKPLGVVSLQKLDSPEAIADGADLLHFRQNFLYQGWLDRTLWSNTRPDPDHWYKFLLVKTDGRLVLLMEPARKRIAAPIPILIWEDRGIVGGPLPKGTGLRLEQRGTGRWRNITISHFRPAIANQQKP
jgi:poly(beta-D-mannuronate) lyase